MPKSEARRTNMGGQTLVMAVLLLTLCSTLLMGLFHISLAAQAKIRLQLSADLAVLSALNCQANGLNSIALTNRAILANDALVGQLNSLVSESAFYRKLAEKFEILLKFIPYAGTVSGLVSTGAGIIERTIRRTASFTLPLAHYHNNALRKSQEIARYLLPVYSLKAARSTLKENMPSAQITGTSEALVFKQATLLQKSIKGLVPEEGKSLKAMTMDPHTMKRNWRIKVAGISPVKKTGATSITTADLVAGDKLRIKVFKRFRWRWKTAISTESRASDFGYQTPSDLMSIETDGIQRALSISILVQSDMPATVIKGPFKENKLRALSAGQLTYTRDTKAEESMNIFNPFWKAELIPVAKQPTVKRIIPEVILREVRH